MLRSAAVFIWCCGVVVLVASCLDPLYGSARDAGVGAHNAGGMDAGEMDAGEQDSGQMDAGPDAGDAGDAGDGPDAGDAGDGACPGKAPHLPTFDAMRDAGRVRSLDAVEERSATWAEGAQRLCYVVVSEGVQVVTCAVAPGSDPLVFDAPTTQTALTIGPPGVLGDLEQSSDGGELFLSMSPDPAEPFQLYRSEWVGNGFGEDTWFDAGFPGQKLTDPNLSADGRELFFTVWTGGPFTDPRLYRMHRSAPDQPYGPAQPVPFGDEFGVDAYATSLSANGHWMLLLRGQLLFASTRACREGPWSDPGRVDVSASAAGWNNRPVGPEWGPDQGVFYDHSSMTAGGSDAFSDIFYAAP